MHDKINTSADRLKANAIETEKTRGGRDPDIAAPILGQGGYRPRRVAFLAPALVRVLIDRSLKNGRCLVRPRQEQDAKEDRTQPSYHAPGPEFLCPTRQIR